MKLVLCLLISMVVGGLTYDQGSDIVEPLPLDVPEVSDMSEGWWVPNIDGTFDWVSKFDYETQTRNIEPRAADVRFYLYTKSNPSSGKQINLNDASALSSSNFNKNNPTRFIIHGWQSTYTSDLNPNIRSSLLNSGSYNVFSVDWSSAAGSINYNSARNAVPDVGAAVAKFIDFLNSSGGMSFSTLTLYGHSLGAHVSGYAGKRVSRGKINTIIGMDAAYPLFSYSDCSSRLCSSDASYVESIHTNGGLLGFLEPIGKAAFYPNGGQSQPGCGADVSGSCAHSRSHIYVAEGIQRNSFSSMSCSSYSNAVSSSCGSTYSSVRMANPSNSGISGYYHTPVKSSSPYGMSA